MMDYINFRGFMSQISSGLATSVDVWKLLNLFWSMINIVAINIIMAEIIIAITPTVGIIPGPKDKAITVNFLVLAQLTKLYCITSLY